MAHIKVAAIAKGLEVLISIHLDVAVSVNVVLNRH